MTRFVITICMVMALLSAGFGHALAMAHTEVASPHAAMLSHDGVTSKSCARHCEDLHVTDCCSGYASHCESTLGIGSTTLRNDQQILMRHLPFEMVLSNKHVFAYEPPPPKS